MGDIVRLVEEAQNREAPVQRLADKVHDVLRPFLSFSPSISGLIFDLVLNLISQSFQYNSNIGKPWENTNNDVIFVKIWSDVVISVLGYISSCRFLRKQCKDNRFLVSSRFSLM